MYEIRSRRFEEDLIATGFAEAFGDVTAGARAIQFADRASGLYRGVGGLIGDGNVSVLRYETSGLTIRFPDTNYINYEKALAGAISLVFDDTQLTTRDGIATVSRQGDFDLNFVPAATGVARGVAVSLTREALDDFLATGGEERAGEVRHRVVEGSGPDGPDGPLLGLAAYVLRYFDSFSLLVEGRSGRLVEALLIETYVRLLVDTGALQLKARPSHASVNVVARAEAAIRARYSEPLTVADVASAVGTNIRSLQAAFREHRGTTPRAYLTAVRLERARELLLQGTAPTVTAVAYECGFTHMGRFGQAYARRFGEYPSEALRRSIPQE